MNGVEDCTFEGWRGWMERVGVSLSPLAIFGVMASLIRGSWDVVSSELDPILR